ncbi:MAG: guanylate kinase [Limisphaerales bacterium]
MSQQKSILIVVSSPSGAGKTTVCGGLLKQRANVRRAVTCTTRAPRDGEKDGRDYYFFSAEEFLKRVQSGHFLEHATVYGNSYGTLKSEVLKLLREGRDVLLAIDVQGAAEIRKQAEADSELAEALVSVFILPPSKNELKKRLKERGSETADTLRKRLNEADNEIRQWKNYDYVIVSDSRERDLERITAIYDAEGLRRKRTALPKSLQASN